MLTHNVEFKTFFDFESSIFHIFHFVATMKEVGGGTTTEAHSPVLLLLQRLVVHALYFDQLYCFTCKLFISFCSLVQRPWSKGGFTTGGRQMTKAAYSGGVPPPKHKVFPPKIPLCQSLIYVTFPK